MNKIRIIATLLICLGTTTAFAQRIPEIQISNAGKKIAITEKGFSGRISAENFKNDPVIYVTSDEANYVLNRYEISYLPERGELVGPFSIYGENVNNMRDDRQVAKIISRAKSGDKFYIENINAVCASCEELKEIKIKAFAMLIE